MTDGCRTLRAAVAVLCLLPAPARAQAGPPWAWSRQASIAAANETAPTTPTGIDVTGTGTLLVQITGTFSGTLTPGCSADGTNYVALLMTPTNTTTAVTSMTSTGIWTGSMAGCRFVRVIGTPWTSGTAVVRLIGVQAGGGNGGGGGGDASEATLASVATNTDLTADRLQQLLDALPDAETHDNPATSTGTTMYCEFDDTTPDSIDEGDAGRCRMSANRNTFITIRDAAGNERGVNVTAANELLVELGAGTAAIGSLTTGTAYIGQAGLNAVTTGGCTPFSLLSANTVNETAVKASAGQLYWLNVTNIGANEVFFKLYNDTTANIDETDTPTLRLVVPGNAAGAGNQAAIAVGVAFSTAITYRITTGAADTDTGAIAANEVLVSGCYF